MGGGVRSIWDGVWWAVVTVGYGDIYAKTVGGRLIEIVVMIASFIGFISTLTARVASRFVQTDTDSDAVLDALHRLEAELAELEAGCPCPTPTPSSS